MANRDNRIDVVVPSEVKEILEEIAGDMHQQTGKTVILGDVVRQAIELYLKQQGIDIPVTVNRGGVRQSARSKRSA